MYCFHPIQVRKWKELPDGSHVRSKEYHFVPCGKCVACLSRKRNEMTYRLKQEENYSSYSFFITLTYDQEQIPVKMVDEVPYFVFNKKHVQDYMKRVRYYMNEMNTELKCSYFLVSEYGSHTYRPHYHMLFFVKNDIYQKYINTIRKILESNWNFGFTVIKPTNDANIHYCTKYCIKNLEELPAQCIEPVFSLSSKRPYLGVAAEGTIDRQFNRYEGTEKREVVVFNNGYKGAMPRIYRQKLGLSSTPAEMSDTDPRLTKAQHSDFLDGLKKQHPEWNTSELIQASTEQINKKFNIMERAARLRQLQRSENL